MQSGDAAGYPATNKRPTRGCKTVARTKRVLSTAESAELKTAELKNRLLDLKTVTARGISSRISRSHQQADTENFVRKYGI